MSPAVTAVRVREALARDVMSTPVLSVAPADSPWRAWRLMLDARVRHVVLAVDDRPVGVVDDRVLIGLWPMGPVAIRQAQVGDFVRRRTACVLPETPVHEVARTMVEDGADAVPVVDEEGRLVGLVTTSDIVAAVAGCRPRADGDAPCE